MSKKTTSTLTLRRPGTKLASVRQFSGLFALVFCLLQSLVLQGQIIYSNNFESSVGPQWSSQQRDVTPRGNRAFLGQFGNGTVALTLSNLAPHTEIDLSCDLFIIRTWDGLAAATPEFFSIAVAGGPTLLRSTFSPLSQEARFRQSFPAPSGAASLPANSGADEVFTLGYSFWASPVTYLCDAVYKLNFRFAHRGSTVTLNFSGANLESSDNETWGLDNVVVALDSIPANAPPRITRPPLSRTAPTNGTAVFSVVTTTNAPLTYQWRFNGTDLPGANRSYLFRSVVTRAREGDYSVRVSNPFGTVESAPASLRVGPPPTDPPNISSISIEDQNAIVAWPDYGLGTVLEMTTNFAAWTSVTAPSVRTNSRIFSTIPLHSSQAFFQLSSGPSLANFWNGEAQWVLDGEALGSDFDFEPSSIIPSDRDLWAFYSSTYATNGLIRLATGRARSIEGLEWKDDGLLFDVGGHPRWSYQSEQIDFLYHHTGRQEPDGWSATPATDARGFLVFGPYTWEIPAGRYTARFRLMIDQTTGVNDVVARIDVNNARRVPNPTELAKRSIRRHDFNANHTWQDFELPFTCRDREDLEFRVYFEDKSYLKSDYAAVIEGHAPYWDGRTATAPSVWKEGNTWFMAYEGSADDASLSPGDIGLATSTNGFQFTRHAQNPILRHDSFGWERARIGSPTLYREDGLWYLYYTGFDGEDFQTGLATGASLTNLTRHPGNPILKTGPAAWDSGIVGPRSSLRKEGLWYYFAYQGGADALNPVPLHTGLARSTNLVDWVKLEANPILPGASRPELLQIAGVWYLYARGSETTTRFRLAPK